MRGRDARSLRRHQHGALVAELFSRLPMAALCAGRASGDVWRGGAVEPVFLEFEAVSHGRAARLAAQGWAARRWNKDDGEPYDLAGSKARARVRGVVPAGRVRGWVGHLHRDEEAGCGAAAEGRFFLELARLSWSLQVPFALDVALRTLRVRDGSPGRLEIVAGVEARHLERCRCCCATRLAMLLVAFLAADLTEGLPCRGASCVESASRYAVTRPCRRIDAPASHAKLAPRLAHVFVDEAARSKAFATEKAFQA